MLSSFHTNTDESNAKAPISNMAFPPSLRHLLDETADILESPSFHNVLTRLLDTSFSRLVDHRVRTDVYKLPVIQEGSAPQEVSIIEDSLSRHVKFASILAVITKEAHQIGRGSPNEYVQALEDVEDMEAFAAVVYSSNFETDHEQSRLHQEHLLNDEPPRDETNQSLQEAQPTMVTRAAELADTAWSGFESVWAKIAG